MDRRRLKQLQQQDGLDPDLLKIYRGPDGNVPDISRLHIHRTNWARRVGLWVMVAGGALLSGLVLSRGLLPWGGDGKVASSLPVSMVAPADIASGEDVWYLIQYQNVDRVTLNNIALVVRYPDGFVYGQSDPAPANQYQNTWELGNLTPGTTGQIRLRGKMVGTVGTIKMFAGTVTYQPKNFSAPFKENFSHSIQITSSLLTLSVTGPARIPIDREVMYTIEYGNTSEQAYRGMVVQVTYPPGFIFKQSEPTPKSPPSSVTGYANVTKQPNSVWYFSQLDKKAKGQIQITGGFSSAAQAGGNNQTVVAQIGFLDASGTFALQQEQRFSTVLLQPNLQLYLILNGQSNDQAVNFGETLQYRIVFKNLGAQTLGDLAIEANIDSSLVDWNALVDRNVGRRDGSRLRWDKEGVAALASLPPLGEGTIDFSLQLKTADAVGNDVTRYVTVSTARAVIGTVDDLLSTSEVTSNTIASSVNTAVDLRAEGRYFDNDNLAVGSGPLPPVVGEKTTFRVYWSLANSLHEVKSVTVTTKLAPDVTWEGKLLASAGVLAFAAPDRQVTWTIPTLQPRQGHDEVNAWFDISVTPKAEQVGKLLLLTSETNFTATDAVTNANVVLMKRSITSNLEDDPFAGGRGLVVEVGQ